MSKIKNNSMLFKTLLSTGIKYIKKQGTMRNSL